MNTTENDIILKLDKDSFELLFRKHFKNLCFFAQRYVKDLDIAKEIVQEAFINLWEKRDSIDLAKPVKSYITTTVYNRSLNYLRDQKKFDKDLLTFENLALSVAASQTDLLASKELDLVIKSAINELPEKCREIFVMSRFENLKYQEIADKLKISVKTVEAQMSKALQFMRIKLADYISIILAFMIFEK